MLGVEWLAQRGSIGNMLFKKNDKSKNTHAPLLLSLEVYRLKTATCFSDGCIPREVSLKTKEFGVRSCEFALLQVGQKVSLLERHKNLIDVTTSCVFARVGT